MDSQSISDLVREEGNGREHLLPILQHIQQKKGMIPEEDMGLLAREMGLSPSEVYGVATFYSFLSVRPQGKTVIRLCKTIACYMKGKDRIVEALEHRLKIKVGETTPDRKFTLLFTNCIGQCHKGPAMLINDKVYTGLTPEKALSVLEEYL